MTPIAEALWLRAVHVVDARGLLPPNRARLTPAELAAEVARRGEDRLAPLVYGWYYPASYGRIGGALSDEEAERLVAALEAEIAQAQTAQPQRALPQSAVPRGDDVPSRRVAECELCGFPIAPWKE